MPVIGNNTPKAPRRKRAGVRLAVVAVLVLTALGLLGLHAVAVGLLPLGASSAYSVAQVTAGLQSHPRRWAGRIVTVRGVALRPAPQGFMLFDQFPPRGPAPVLWVASSAGSWRMMALVWEEFLARYLPGSGNVSISGVFRLRLPSITCAQGEHCPAYLVQ